MRRVRKNHQAMILDLLLSLIPWRQIVAGLIALVSFETLLVCLWHAAITNRKQFR